MKGVHLSLYFVTSRLILFITFVVFIFVFGGQLSADKVFLTMALFNIIRIPVTRHLPQSIASTAELMVTCQRIQVRFLNISNLGSNAIQSVFFVARRNTIHSQTTER